MVNWELPPGIAFMAELKVRSYWGEMFEVLRCGTRVPMISVEKLNYFKNKTLFLNAATPSISMI